MVGEAGMMYIKEIRQAKKSGNLRIFEENSDFYFAPFVQTPFYFGFSRSDEFEGDLNRLCDILEENYERDLKEK